jgi:ATP-dependent Zn protease
VEGGVMEIPDNSLWNMFLSSWLPFLLLIAVYIFFMRRMKKDGIGWNPQVDALKEINETLKEISQKLDKR